jgi:predicted nucleic acid-binding protein
VDEAVVPSLWWFEIRNILVIGERHKRIAESDTAGFLRYLSSFPLRIDRSPDEPQVLRLARVHRLSVYDACYLELALRENIPLASIDAQLVVAAHAESIPLIGSRN